MNDYLKYEIRRRIVQKYKEWKKGNIAGIRYAGKKLMSAEEGNAWIRDKLLSGEAFSASRFGNSEMNAIIIREENVKTRIDRANVHEHLCNDAGFFPNEENAIDKYYELYVSSIRNIDFMGIWLFINNEEYMIQKYMHAPECSMPRALEPFYFEHPWSGALEGKKVLVVHPFADTIQAQYKKRELLFDNEEILPLFELKTIKAVQTISSQMDDRFESWFDALEWMKSEIRKVDFDVALLGCGAYGIPLQSMIREMGKQSIYVGGGLQILFGIKGKRWDDHPFISKLYNENWVRPSELEKIRELHKLEQNGPYW